jgi:plasmid stability protein
VAHLLIKDIPEHVYRELTERAARHRRSVAREALMVLESNLRVSAATPAFADPDPERASLREGRLLAQRLLLQASTVKTTLTPSMPPTRKPASKATTKKQK